MRRASEKISGGAVFFPRTASAGFSPRRFDPSNAPPTGDWREGGPRARRPRAATRARASSGRARQTCLRSSERRNKLATSSGARRTLPPPSLPPRPRARAVSGKCTSRSRICRSSRRASQRSPTAPSPALSRRAGSMFASSKSRAPRQSPPSRAHPGASTRAARRPLRHPSRRPFPSDPIVRRGRSATTRPAPEPPRLTHPPPPFARARPRVAPLLVRSRGRGAMVQQTPVAPAASPRASPSTIDFRMPELQSSSSSTDHVRGNGEGVQKKGTSAAPEGAQGPERRRGGLMFARDVQEGDATSLARSRSSTRRAFAA